MLNSEITEANEEEEEEEGAAPHYSADTGAQRRRIRQIIEHQKSLFCSSSLPLTLTSSAAAVAPAASSSRFSVSSSRRSSSLMELMKSGSTSLRRLFDMEHISLANYLDDYSATPVVRTVPLWGSSDSEAGKLDPWASFKVARRSSAREIGDVSQSYGEGGICDFASHGSFMEADHTCCHYSGEVLLDALGRNDMHPSIKNNNSINEARIQDYREEKKTGRVIKEDEKSRKLTRKRSFRRLPGFGLWRWRWRGFSGLRSRLRRFRALICGRIRP